LCATALGTTVAEAQSLAYTLVKRVHWNGVYYRTDIGYRAIVRERQESIDRC
jgi:phosphoribosylamine---glycine ligase